MSRYDTIVIGAGMAGLTTACQLVQAEQKVLLVSHGIGALLLASGCIDVLGFQPATNKEPVKNPMDKLDDFLAEYSDHPYKFTGRQAIETGIDRFRELVNNETFNYQGEVHNNWLLPSAAGAIHPTCLAPNSFVNGDLSQSGSMLIVGFRELRDFYPALISQNLNAQDLGIEADSVTIKAPAPITDKMNTTPIELARAFDNPDFRWEVAHLLKNKSKDFARIGFPAVLGLKRHHYVLEDLERKLEKPVFEISTLPPSVPGRRLFERLKQIFVEAKGRLILGSKVVDGLIEEGEVKHIRFETVNRLKTVQADNYILATGGIFGGGIQTDADGGIGKVWESIFDLPVQADENRHMWFAEGFLDPKGQPFAQYGVHINSQLKPVNGSSGPLAKNLYIAGATIAGTDWTQGRTGNGVAIATATTIVDQITKQAN